MNYTKRNMVTAFICGLGVGMNVLVLVYHIGLLIKIIGG